MQIIMFDATQDLKSLENKVNAELLKWEYNNTDVDFKIVLSDTELLYSCMIKINDTR